MWIIVRDDQTDKEKRDQIEYGDSPENLFRGPRHRFLRILTFSSSQTDQFRPAEGEGCCDKDRADTFESVCKCARIMPGFHSEVSTLWSTATVNDDAEDDEAENC